MKFREEIACYTCKDFLLIRNLLKTILRKSYGKIK